MSDEKLITVANNRLWASGEEGQASAELYRRKKIEETKNSSIQKQIRNITIAVLIIAAITLFFTVLPLFQKSLKPHNLACEIRIVFLCKVRTHSVEIGFGLCVVRIQS